MKVIATGSEHTNMMKNRSGQYGDQSLESQFLYKVDGSVALLWKLNQSGQLSSICVYPQRLYKAPQICRISLILYLKSTLKHNEKHAVMPIAE